MPNRSTSSFTLSWGLLNIPVSAYAGTEEVRVQRKEFCKHVDGEGNESWQPVGRAITDKSDGSIIDRSDVVRMAESTSGVWVELDDDEIAAATLPRGLAEVETFIATRNVGQYLTEGLYQVRPRRVKGKSDPSGVKALGLLFEAMKARKVVALVKVSLRGPARYALLDAEGNMRFVVTADAVRTPMDMPVATITKQERELALALIDSVGVTTPKLVDTSALAIQAFVDQKAAGVVPEAPAEPAPTSDLLGDLLASIASRKEKEAVAS
jgi:non-homologous end joining protein Ku